MHDPMTVAFEIKYPWREKPSQFWPKGYRQTFITIWHVDPEIGGSDDSCGWFTPPFSETTRDICKILASDEAREPWFFALDAETNSDPILCERLLFGAFMLVSRCLVNRGVIRRRVSVADATRWAAEGTHNSVDNFRSSLCFKSGYHSNWYDTRTPNTPEQDKWFREQSAKSFFGAIAGWILRDRRWWFQKPRWHVWHWQIKIEPLMLFKRWAFSRCRVCGGGFSWGESPCSNQWDSTGPQWFKSETDVMHGRCSGVDVVGNSASVNQNAGVAE